MRLLYSLIIRAYTAAIHLAAPFHAKARKWVQGRRGLMRSMQQTTRPRGPLIWFHCASLGEFEQGRPVIEQLKNKRPDISILLTFFSPSGYEIRKNYAFADFVFYLPADTASHARRFLDHFRPSAAVFVKYEFWLHYLRGLQGRQIPTYSISALFRPGQLFFRPLGAPYRKLLHAFTHIYTQDQASAGLLQQHGITHCSVSGDTRFDRVAAVARQTQKIPIVENFKGHAPLWVAGSAWPEDEAHLVQAMAALPDTVKMVIAPHEIGEGHLRQLENQLAGWPVLRYSQATQQNPAGYRVLIIDNIGMLSSIYAYADVAYVGGAFKTGLHNILEPATFGIPVVFGPHYHKFPEAQELVRQQGAFSVADGKQLQAKMQQLFQDAHYRQATGHICAQYIAQRTGAASIITRRLLQTIL